MRKAPRRDIAEIVRAHVGAWCNRTATAIRVNLREIRRHDFENAARTAMRPLPPHRNSCHRCRWCEAPTAMPSNHARNAAGVGKKTGFTSAAATDVDERTGRE